MQAETMGRPGLNQNENFVEMIYYDHYHDTIKIS